MGGWRVRCDLLHSLDAPPREPWNREEIGDLAPKDPIEAAVLVGWVERANGVHLLLTRRNDALRLHAGQIAFPGGRRDPSDRDLVATALREADEEVGLGREHVQPLGFLDPLLTITGFAVTPVLARLDPDFTLRLHQGEVAEAFEAPLAALLDPMSIERIGAVFHGRMRHTWQIRHGRHRIWGATAGIILNLARFLQRET